MKQKGMLANWQKIFLYNQVMYGEDVALITGCKQAGKYHITVIKSNQVAECHDVKRTDLTPIDIYDSRRY